MKNRARICRRTFLRRGAATFGAAVSAPMIVPSSAFGADHATAPGDRIVMGAIGVGGMGRHDLGNMMTHGDVQFVAVCDVDAGRLGVAKGMVDSHYGTSDCAAYNDFREILARDDIDAVLIATPDHWHTIISIEAVRAGKDVYCEKPISVTIAEGRAVVDAVERYGAVYQSGTQRRNIPCFAFAALTAQAGKVGRLHTIHTGLSTGQVCDPQPIQPVPKGFDYDRWLGPAPFEPYTRKRCHGSFRWNYDYSGGQLTDIGAHFNDLAQWGNNSERTGPVKYSGWAEFPTRGLFNTPVHYEVTATYADGTKLIMHDSDPRMVRFEGDEGWISVDDTGLLEAEPKSLLQTQGIVQEGYNVMTGHHRDFLDCVKTRRKPIAHPEVAQRSTTTCHIANLCFRLGCDLNWNPETERFVDNDEADLMLSRAMRSPWRI